MKFDWELITHLNGLATKIKFQISIIVGLETVELFCPIQCPARPACLLPHFSFIFIFWPRSFTFDSQSADAYLDFHSIFFFYVFSNFI